MKRRTLLASAGAALAGGPPSARAATVVGVTKTEILIGHTIPYSGPASAYGVIGKGHAAFFKRLNEQGGIAGRKVNFVSLDDGYSPPKTVEMVRRLVEQDQVAFLFNTLGTPNNLAIWDDTNDECMPQLLNGTGAPQWGDVGNHPWTTGMQLDYVSEAGLWVQWLQAEHPDATKIAAVAFNNDFGKSYVEEAKSAYETLTGDLKELAAVKSPAELFQLQAKLARRNFDTLVAYSSKNTDAALKLANETFAPISGRISLAAEKISKAA